MAAEAGSVTVYMELLSIGWLATFCHAGTLREEALCKVNPAGEAGHATTMLPSVRALVSFAGEKSNASA